jgi:hypothetical protein
MCVILGHDAQALAISPLALEKKKKAKTGRKRETKIFMISMMIRCFIELT